MKFSLDLARSVSLQGVLKSYITQNYDFGIAYAHLHPYWSDLAGSCQPSSLQALKKRVDSFNLQGMSGKSWISQYIRSQHVWDLYANRVVSSWVTPKELQGISHVWVDKEDRVGVMFSARFPVTDRSVTLVPWCP